MEDIIGPLIAIVAGVTAAFFVLWVLLALFMRLLAILVIYWVATFAVGLVVGVVGGLAIPLRVLSGRARVQPKVATPDDVVAKKVIKFEPRGEAKNFGWDRAWPVYNPYQARNDARAVVSETRTLIALVWARISPSRWNRPPAATTTPAGKPKRMARLRRAVLSTPGLAWLVIASTPVAGFFLGVWISIVLWLAAMFLLGGLVYLGQQAWILTYRWFDRLSRKREGAKMKCTHCYYVGTTPSYKCANDQCSIIHRDISPGPLGMTHRRCECGTGFPTTVRAAAKHLTAVCPRCGTELVEGAGTRRSIQLPTIGAVSAGKTRFLASGAVALEQAITGQGGTFSHMNPQSLMFMQAARSLVSTGESTTKTPFTSAPTGLPFLLDTGSRLLELHFVDAAGESFTNMDSTQALGYLDAADTFVLVIDPLGIPRIYDEADRAGLTRRLQIATADQEDAYASAIDRLRAENVNLRNRHLAVVVTKLDLLQTLPAGMGMMPGNSDGIRQWLVAQEQDGLVRRLEDDFADNVTYFAVDLMQQRPPLDPLSPVHVFQWMLDKSKANISITPTVAAPAAS